MGWIVAVAGLAVSAYGGIKAAKDNKKAAQDANAANKTATDEANAQNWTRYMRQRGVGENGQAVNTRLPEWATMPNSQVMGYRKKAAPAASGMPGLAPLPVVPTPYNKPLPVNSYTPPSYGGDGYYTDDGRTA
jgi:hypothetical protein